MGKKNWIRKAINPKHKGDLRRKAEAAGHLHDDKIDKGWLRQQADKGGTTGKQARLAIALGSMRHGR